MLICALNGMYILKKWNILRLLNLHVVIVRLIVCFDSTADRGRPPARGATSCLSMLCFCACFCWCDCVSCYHFLISHLSARGVKNAAQRFNLAEINEQS